MVGVYFADRATRAEAIARELAESQCWRVEQRWAALGGAPPLGLASVTAEVTSKAPKFTLINRLLKGARIESFAHVLVVDDDVGLPSGFLDRYLALVEEFHFSLAQPARTHGSFTDHKFVSQLTGIRARETRFVEIGPLFSMTAEALPLLLPFDEDSPMGWGYDLVWPITLAAAGLRLGIVDELAVAHDLRPPVTNYKFRHAKEEMLRYLSKHESLDTAQAFQILRSYP